ncbi:DUF748 domain-containing protein [Aquabacterium fontiphilum]
MRAEPSPSPRSADAPPARGGGGPSRLWRVAAAVAVVAVGWTAGVGAWLPGVLKPRVAEAAEQALGVPVALDELTLSPWTLTARLSGLRVGAPDAPMLRVQAIEAQVSLASLWHRAPVLRRLQVQAPALTLVREAPDRLNISPVLARLREQGAAAPASEGPARFAVFNIALEQGSLRYEDRVLGQTHAVDRIRLGVPFVSSLPSQIDVAVQPLLEARVNGSALRLAGSTLPFQAGHRSELKLTWRDVDLAEWVPHAGPWLPPAWRVEAPRGRLSTDLTLTFEQQTVDPVPSLSVRGQVVLTDLGLHLPRAPGLGQVQLGWQALTLSGLDLQPLTHQAAVGRVAVEGLSLAVRPLPRPGTVRTAARSTATPAPQGEAAVRWRWSVGEAVVAASRLDVQTEATAPWPVLQDVKWQVRDLRSDAKAPPARWQLGLKDEVGSRLQAQGEWQLADGAGQATVTLADAAIVPWLRPLAPTWRLPMAPTAGRVTAQASLAVQYTPSWQLQVTNTRVQLQGFAAKASQGTDHLMWQDGVVDGVTAQWSARQGPESAAWQARIASVDVNGLDLGWTRMPAGADGTAASDGAMSANRPSGQWSIGRVSCQGCQLSVRDAATDPSAIFRLARTTLVVQGLSHDAVRPIQVELDTLAQGNGRVRFEGEVRRSPLAVQARLALQSLDLRVLQPYLAPHLNVQLASAQAQADGRLSLSAGSGAGAGADALTVRYRGRLGLDRVQLLDKVNEAEFLRWRRLALDGTDLHWRQGQVQADLGRIALQDFYGRLILQPDARLNLASIVRRGDEGESATSITTPQAAVPPPASARGSTEGARAPADAPPPNPMDLRWRGIQLTNGQVDFTDTYIRPSYSARLTRLNGTISAVAARQPEPAQLQLDGAVDDGAPLSIKGTLHPLGPRLFTDIEGEARGVELTRMTPYAARYAGYAIERGTLSVNVRYKVEEGRLAASNRLFLDQLTFGEPSGDPDATRLPVRLAVALLKNSRGEIDINLPISGSLDDPQFSVGGILWRVVVNLVTKAVTAPFALLMGGDSDEAGEVPFAPGQAELTEAARQRLDAMSARLTDRPALKLDAIGQAHAAVDEEGLREAQVAQWMRVAKARALGVPIDEVEVMPQERDRWLAAAYRAADIRKPRNVVGVPKALPPAEQMALLKAAAPVDAAALRALADRRADTVKAYLITRLPADRVRLAASVVQQDTQAPAAPPPGVRFVLR